MARNTPMAADRYARYRRPAEENTAYESSYAMAGENDGAGQEMYGEPAWNGENPQDGEEMYDEGEWDAGDQSAGTEYLRPGAEVHQPRAWQAQIAEDEDASIYTAPRSMRTEPQPDEPVIYDELPMDELEDEDAPKVIATNRTVKLTCTLAAFCSLLALFYAFAEKDSRAIRHFAVQSAALGAMHVLGAVFLLLFGSLLSMIPLLGFVMTVVFWVLYAALAIACVILRVRLMTAAHEGIYDELPVAGEWLERFV